MTDRYPLVYNPSAGQIQELSAGDNITIDSSALKNVTISGVTTFTGGDINIDSGGVYYDSANNRLGIGTTSPRFDLSLGATTSTDTATPTTLDLGGSYSNTAGANAKLRLYWDGTNTFGFGVSANQLDYISGSSTSHVFHIGGSERFRCDSSGRLLVNTSSNSGSNAICVIQGNSDSATGPGVLDIKLGTTRPPSANTTIGVIRFPSTSQTTGSNVYAEVRAVADGDSSSDADIPGRLVFSTTADGASSPTERMRIPNNGAIDIGGYGNAYLSITTPVGSPLTLNRTISDGDLVRLKQDGTTEGTISVSGTTVSYNGAHLSRWSQLPGGAERTEILRGTVLSNIDEMCGWGEEDNEQLNRMMVSDVEGDPNVSGVFQAWDDDDDTYTDDFYCAMTGDFIIRIAESVTVQRGDLLMSAGDGTAKPQDDDIIRSKTIAKVTSNHVTCTYDDGSYCVPCVLMAC